VALVASPRGQLAQDAHRHRAIHPQRPSRHTCRAHSPGPVLRGTAARGQWQAAVELGGPDGPAAPGDLRIQRVSWSSGGDRWDSGRVATRRGPCTVTATVSSGRSSIGASGRVPDRPGRRARSSTFKLSHAGKELLGGASGNRLAGHDPPRRRARARSAGASAALLAGPVRHQRPRPVAVGRRRPATLRDRSAAPSSSPRAGIGGILAGVGAAGTPLGATTATVSAGGRDDRPNAHRVCRRSRARIT